jgi:AcrR family transcriptional regulator
MQASEDKDLLSQSSGSGSTRNGAGRGIDRTAAPDRRTAIANALQRAMLKKGFSSTSLSDLARAAGMTVSHLLYYFPSKEAVLEYLNDAITDHITSELIAHRGDTSAEQINNLVDYYCGGRAVPSSYRKLVLQQMAAATDDPALRNRKKQQAAQVIGYLEDLFRSSPGLPGLSAEDAAVVAVSLWVGLTVNSLFLDGLTSRRARDMLRSAMLVLAGLDEEAPRTKKPARGNARANYSRPRV